MVWVALGSQKPSTLVDYAALAIQRVPGSTAYLITDQPSMWEGSFPGQVVPYLRKNRSAVVRWVERNHPEKVLKNSGFWLKTLERLFVLSAIGEWVEEGQPIIHFESDVLSLVTPAQIQVLIERCQRIAFPSTAPNAGCASILFARNADVLGKGIKSLEELYLSEGRWLTDMELLGLALQEGFADELPTHPENAWSYRCVEHEPACRVRLVFDASAVGMYLFGVDPLHTAGVLVSGYQQKDFPHHLADFSWSIGPECHAEQENGDTISFSCNGKGPIAIANLHVHAKISLDAVSADSLKWQDTLSEANGEKPREPQKIQSEIFQRRALKMWRLDPGAPGGSVAAFRLAGIKAKALSNRFFSGR